MEKLFFTETDSFDAGSQGCDLQTWTMRRFAIEVIADIQQATLNNPNLSVHGLVTCIW